MSRSYPSLREVFEAAIALGASDRGDFLDRHCPDPVQRARVEALIAADADAGEPLLPDALDRLSVAIGPARAAELLPPGSRVGPFELLEILGEGGSSTVFRAVRNIEGAVQHVALKLMRRGLYSPEAQRLFSREQRALIQLRHPNIARMIEGGVHESGLPYIALELVEGSTITDFARARGLELDERLRLFGVVCAAVEAAHRALIVHRDLKPSNVLVTEDGEVKLLDFGIAKLLAEEDESARTQMPAFTPAYAAPEQRDDGPITTATDVYALGVLLGELVTGELVNDGSDRTPSSRITNESPAGGAAATPITRRQVRGDLDAIILKALDADPARRYASAGRLADDIERLLARQPVSAQIPSRWYRTRKFMLRHKGGVASTVAFLLAILAALGMALWQARLAREQAALAERATVRANTTLDFIVDLLATASADLPKADRPTPEALVAQAAKNAREDSDLDPLVRAQLFTTLAEVARSNGDNRQAERLINEAIVHLHEQGSSAASPEWIAAMVSKGNLLHDTDRTAEADSLMKGLLPVLDGVDTEGAVSALLLYAATRAYADDADGAVEIGHRALKKAQRVFGADSIDSVSTAAFLGQVFSKLNRYADSEVLLTEAITRWRRLGLPRNETLARNLYHLARSKYRLGKFNEVEALYTEGNALMRSVGAAPYFRLSQGLRGYAEFLIDMERFDQAKAALDESRQIDIETRGAQSADAGLTLQLLARWHRERHELIAAERLYQSTHAVFAAHVEQVGLQWELERTRLHWSQTLIELGRHDQAAALLDEAKAGLARINSPADVGNADAHCIAGQLAIARGQPELALGEIDNGLAIVQALDIPDTTSEIDCRVQRTNALIALRRSREARAEADLALTRQQATNPVASLKLTALLALRARAEQADNDAAAAARSIAQARALAAPTILLAEQDRAVLGL
ncbi:serine/threonine-protein kinase [Dokdonella immobilis]|nr:serine/threonine-protein kinase [Dokdonella immobilis]